MTPSIKLRIARAQLGTALSLFINDRDPFSVHALACGGSEIIEGLAEAAGAQTLSSHILKTVPDVDNRELKRLRNQHWNALKHFYARSGNKVRDDETLMESFTDRSNDAVLFMGWLDYVRYTGRLPIEAQVFQLWWYATNEDKLISDVDPFPWRSEFPGIASSQRFDQKRQLLEAVRRYEGSVELLADPRSETDALVSQTGSY